MSAVLNKTAICDACETVAHCSKKGCVPIVTRPAEMSAATLLHYLDFIHRVGGAPLDATPEQRLRIERAAEAAQPTGGAV